MKIQGKVWGKTKNIFKNSNFEIHIIEAKKGGFCSIHQHAYKFNAFYIENGLMKISIYENDDYNSAAETIIKDGDLTIIKPGNFHKFEAIEDTICYEIYWVELDHNDIERKNVGGIK